MFLLGLNKNKAFTLIELLVVIAVIGLLASVVLVSLKGTREKAKVARAVSDLNQISKAIYLYWNDTGMPPPHDHSWSDSCERAAFGSGNFSPKPTGWSGPYVSWPKNPWGYEYHWERGACVVNGNRYSISVHNVPQDAAQMIDDQVDDGNFSTGHVRWNNGRLEYNCGRFDFPDMDIHFTSCNP
jgi:type II secretion system protein G